MHAIVGILGQIMSLLGGGIAGGLKLVSNIFVAGAKMALQYHQEAIAFSREVGMSAKQAQAYTEVLTTRAKNLGEKYGIASEAVKELEKNLARASGRAMILTDADAERMIQINKLVGPETANRFTEEIMQGMGGQLETVEGAVSKAYATAAKRGLNAQKFSEKVAQNLSMANKLSFKNGVDGITKMTALSEKLGFNLQSVENAANKFMNLQDSIENAAKLSMLGGAAGAFGGNALDMSYEANYDPEAFTERMTKMLGGYAQFNEKTGMSKVNGMSMDFVRGIADAMGLDVGEATRIAKKQAEMKYKESKFGSRFGNLNEEQRDLIMNKSYVKDGKLMINDMNGKPQDISGGQIPPKLLEELEQFGRMDDRQLMEQQATTLISINEQIEGIKTAFSGHIAEAVSKHLPEIQNFIGEMGRTLMAHAPAIASNFEKLMTTALKPENVSKVMEFVKGFINFASWVTKFLTQNWAILLGAMFFNPILKGLRALFGAGGGGGASSAAAAGKSKYKNRTWKQAKNDARLSMRGKNGLTKGFRGLKTLWRNSRGFRGGVKGVAGIGTALAALDIGSTLFDFSSKKSAVEEDKTKTEAQKKAEIERLEKGRNNDLASAGGAIGGGSLGAWIGGAIGTAIAPGVGTAIGAALGGGIAGYFAGKGARAAAESIQGSKATLDEEPHAIGGYVGGRSLIGDKVKTALDSGEAVVPVKGQWDFLSAVQDLKGALGMTTYLASPNTNGGSSVIRERSNTQSSIINNYFASHSAVGSSVIPDTQRNLQAMSTEITAKPVGGKENIYVPSNNQSTGVAGEVKIKDFNVNISGTIKLDGGNSSQNIDVRSLLSDVSFVSALKDVIRESMASDINGGRIMMDTAYMRGMPSQSTTMGRLTS